MVSRSEVRRNFIHVCSFNVFTSSMWCLAGGMLGARHSLDRPQVPPSRVRRASSALTLDRHVLLLLAAPAAAVSVVGIGVIPLTGLGPASWLMTLHIAAMSVVAPLCVLALRSSARSSSMHGRTTNIWTATLLQLVLLWAWHMPVAQAWAMSSGTAAAAMLLSLLLAAFWFWWSVATAARPWQPMFALLVTGKLTCLIGALLIFAPRVLCAPAASPTVASALTLGDQQLAGLLMISACSLSYVLAGVILAGLTMGALARTGPIGFAMPR